jgi:2-oxoglutarate ferredoxin oxidoreductase subunit beta
MSRSKFLDTRALPHFWCEGCGNGIVLGAIVRALEHAGAEPEKTVVVTGIGCTGKLDDYVACHTVHGTHGRALPIATGIKAANPELTVLAVLGDGDGATIGGNHLLHSARRNVGVTAVLINNFNYGMTGGQYSGTTPQGSRTATSVYGGPEAAMDLCRVVEAAGANYVARSTVCHGIQLQRFIEQALSRDGFSFVEAVSTCPTYFGRLNRQPSPVEMLLSLKDRAVARGSGEAGTPGIEGKFEIGVFADKGLDSFSARYAEIQKAAVARAQARPAVPMPAPARATGKGHWEIVLAGFGGQGLGLAGQLLGEAAVEMDGRYASQVQAYGSAARGGFAKSETIVSSDEIKYPGVTRPDFIVALSDEAYRRYAGRSQEGCVLIVDSGAVAEIGGGAQAYPISETAERIGQPQSANLVALGLLAAISGAVSAQALEDSIRKRLPGNRGALDAFRSGFGLAEGPAC